jgi:phospholipid/cholesterol/gamma-HCH transport system substrate-binding protein
MESDARYAWVGLAIVTLLVALAAGFYWLSGGAKPAVNRFTVYFKAQSLEGLQLNSDVRMQGIKVGKVADYTILPGEAKTVRVLLEVDTRTPIWQGVEAVVTRNLVTGLAAIDLDNVLQTDADIGPPPAGEPYPVIKEGVPQITRISNTLEGLGKAGGEAVDRVNTLLSEENQAALSSILSNVSGITGDLRDELRGELRDELRAELRRLGPALNASLGAAQQAAIRLDQVGAELTPVVRESGRLVARAERRFDQLASETEVTLSQARTSMNSLRELQSQLQLSLDLGVQDIQITSQALRTTSDSVLITSQEFRDPGRIIYGPHAEELGPGER